MCRELHVLPHPGALLDQDYLFVIGMDFVVEAQQEKDRLDEIQRNAEASRRQPSR